MQEDYVLNMYLCRDTEFIIGASICMQGKGLADLTTYELELKDYNIKKSFVPCYNMNYTYNNILDRLFHLSIIYDAKYHY